MSFLERCHTVQEAAAPPLGDGRNWFAVFTRSHHEKRVVEYLTQREIESFLPLYRTVHQWTHYRKATLELPLFPNYLFVHIASGERVRVLQAPGVVSLVGQGMGNAPMQDEDIDCLRSGLHLRNVEPHPYLAVGDKARILSGPLAGLRGVVLRRKNGLRVVLTVDFIMQSVAVEVDANELELCDDDLRD